jgi:hypothetical protein
MPAARTHRRWTTIVGIVTPTDVKTLQTKVRDYHAQLQASVDRAAGTPAALPLEGDFSAAAWGDLSGRVSQFLDESSSEVNPLAYVHAGSAYDEGRDLVTELDRWRDALADRKAPGVPPAMPVPRTELGLGESLGLGVMLLAALFLWHESK